MAGTSPDFDNVRMGGPDGIRIPQETGRTCFVVTNNPGSVTIGGTQVFTASGAIPVVSGTYMLGGSGVDAMTLATPLTPAQDGVEITIIASTAHAHTVTTAANKIVPSHSVVTYAAAGDYVELVASGGLWYPIGVSGAVIS